MIVPTLLPHERSRLEHRLHQLGLEQAVVAETLSEAMDQSSETYHDNAPADAANLESKRVSMMAKFVMELLKRPDNDYPDPNTPNIQLGSLAILEFFGERTGVVVVGAPQVYDEETFRPHFELDDEVLIITTEAPLGQSLIGLCVGESGSYKVDDGREFSYQVLSVDNETMVTLF